MLNPFIELIATILQLYNYVIIAWVITSLLISFEIINRFNPIVQRVQVTLDKLVEPALRPIRNFLSKFLPDLGGIDLSPIALILAIQFAQSALYNWFYNL